MIDHVREHVVSEVLIYQDGWIGLCISGILWISAQLTTSLSQNVHADRLSKEGLSLEPGSWSLMISDGDCSCFIQDFSIPGL